MKLEHQKTLELLVKQMMKDEEIEKDRLIEKLNKEILNQKNAIKELEDKHRINRNIASEYAEYKAYYFSVHAICPHCNWDGGFDSYEWGYSCDFCQGSWVKSIEELKNTFEKEIREKYFSEKEEIKEDSQDMLPF